MTTYKIISVNNRQILSAYFLDSLRGFCYSKSFSIYGGYDYTFHSTTNGGNNWTLKSQNYNTDPVTSLFFLNINTGWGCWGGLDNTFGSGRIVKTTNGGANWVYQYYAIKGVSSVFMFDSARGFAISYDSLLFTSNGGTNWIQTYLGPGLCKMKFLNSLDGYILGYFSSLYKTIDGGYNWSNIVLNYPGGNPTDISFINSQTGWMQYNSGSVYKTSNGGSNWTLMSNLGLVPKYLYFPDNDVGFIGLNNGKVYFTDNGALNWITKVDAFNDLCRDVSFINNIGLISTGSGNLKRTTNNGLNWINVYSCNYSLNSIYADTTNDIFYVAGDSGIFMKSTNFGSDWIQSKLAIVNFNCIKFINNSTGIICGNAGMIYRSTDYGNNWMQMSSGTSNYLNGITYNGDYFYICGSGGIVLRSENSGINWSTIYTFANGANNYGIHFIDQNTGHLINYKYYAYPSPYSYSTIYTTTTGGSTWTINFQYQWPPYVTPPKMTSIRFFDQNTGYITTDNGDLIWTPNGGVGGFSYIHNFFNSCVNSSARNTFGNVWIVGSGGMILTSMDVNVSIKGNEYNAPKIYALFQNYPNPFNPLTKIQFEAPKTSHIKIIIYNINGREVESLVNQRYNPGKYEVIWNAGENPSGVYFAKLNADNYSKTIKMLLLK